MTQTLYEWNTTLYLIWFDKYILFCMKFFCSTGRVAFRSKTVLDPSSRIIAWVTGTVFVWDSAPRCSSNLEPYVYSMKTFCNDFFGNFLTNFCNSYLPCVIKYLHCKYTRRVVMRWQIFFVSVMFHFFFWATLFIYWISSEIMIIINYALFIWVDRLILDKVSHLWLSRIERLFCMSNKWMNSCISKMNS